MKLISQGDLSLFIVSPSYPSGVIELSLENIIVIVSDSPTQAMAWGMQLIIMLFLC
jgi:hypothetical protein